MKPKQVLVAEKENPDSGQCHMDVVESGQNAIRCKSYHNPATLRRQHFSEACHYGRHQLRKTHQALSSGVLLAKRGKRGRKQTAYQDPEQYLGVKDNLQLPRRIGTKQALSDGAAPVEQISFGVVLDPVNTGGPDRTMPQNANAHQSNRGFG